MQNVCTFLQPTKVEMRVSEVWLVLVTNQYIHFPSGVILQVGPDSTDNALKSMYLNKSLYWRWMRRIHVMCSMFMRTGGSIYVEGV